MKRPACPISSILNISAVFSGTTPSTFRLPSQQKGFAANASPAAKDANQGQFRIHPSIAQSTVPQGSNLEYSSQAVVFWLDWVEFILAETRNCPGNLRSSGFFHVALLEAKGMLVTHTCR
jgi:hypothetical protein